MQERNILSGTTATILAPFVDGWESAFTWLIVVIILIIGDARFGCMASKQRGEPIRRSRLIRRSVNKLVDYICWISIAWALSHSFGAIFGIPYVVAVIMLGVCAIEVSSIIDNYFEYRGVKKKINLVKLFAILFKARELEECIEDKKDEEHK